MKNFYRYLKSFGIGFSLAALVFGGLNVILATPMAPPPCLEPINQWPEAEQTPDTPCPTPKPPCTLDTAE